MQVYRLLLAAGLMVLVLHTGCSTSRPLNTGASSDGGGKQPKLVRTQVGSEVTLQWQSELGAIYGVVYSTNISDNRAWRLLTGYDHIVGHGGSQQVTFTAPVSGNAYYRLRESRGR